MEHTTAPTGGTGPGSLLVARGPTGIHTFESAHLMIVRA